MTKEILERAKKLDGDIETINKLSRMLDCRQLRIINDVSGAVFRFVELDKDTHDELLTAMKDVLTKRKSLKIKEFEEF